VWDPVQVRIPLPGRHNVSNALLTAAAAYAQGLGPETVVAGLAQMTSVAGRLEPIALRPDVTVLNDSYNANPASMSSALQTLSRMPGRRVAMLGDMAERSWAMRPKIGMKPSGREPGNWELIF